MLENAALLYASGQDAGARELLEQGVADDQDTKLSPLAWLALFDLMQRAGDRAAFDQLAMQYVVQFERSAPAWDETAKPPGGEQGGGGGYLAITGKLSAGSAAQLEGLKRAIEKCVPRARIDLASVTGFDDAGARLLAADLARARGQRMELAMQRPEKLRAAIEATVAKGRDAGEGAWLLSLELMQWHHEQGGVRRARGRVRGRIRAVAAVVGAAAAGAGRQGVRRRRRRRPRAQRESAEAADKDVARLDGALAGATPAQLAQLADFASRERGRADRHEPRSSGSISSARARCSTRSTASRAQRRAVQIVGASPIVRALLLLIGISPRHFVKKVELRPPVLARRG